MRKITFIGSTFASAATAFGLGALVFTSPNAPAAAFPQPTPTVTTTPDATPMDDAEDVAATVPNATPLKATQAPSSTPTKAKHAKPRTTPETDDTATLPRHAKPSATPSAGSKGPLKDAEDDGKILDDLGAGLPLPDVGVTIPDAMLPFPGHGKGQEADDAETTLSADEYPYEEAWGDTPETAADPGVVCDAELAEALGVPLAESCSTGHSPVDMWDRWNNAQPEGPVVDLSGGNGWF
ncbi:gp23 [Streptomyces phage phiBT1]|uniref:Gp23 n=1 Tax=Lomovskayavirus BT1 TaxID=225588 RepID=Q858X8_9CAUD|nr:gp23 [Streptomyces phage phiBT1]CAD80147.1 gp23 [Lomovskayavirus BT1]